MQMPSVSGRISNCVNEFWLLYQFFIYLNFLFIFIFTNDIRALTMNFGDINGIEKATRFSRRETSRFGIALLFIIMVMLFTDNMHAVNGQGALLLVVAAMIGGYMAMNIGANDVANNVGPAVGAKAITMTGAIIIAAIFETAGALLAGGEVVSTIKSGIIDPSMISDVQDYVYAMIAALLAGAIWLNVATAMGAPVSTTHSIVGAVLGAGIAAGGWGIANWTSLTGIAASWVISPVLGGVVAAIFLFWIKRSITYQADMVQAAQKMVPVLVALMAWAFTAYLVLKGLNKVVKMSTFEAALIGLVVAIAVYFLVKAAIAGRAISLNNDKDGINSLFTIPLIFSAALLSFAHGANDVANAVGPLAAIYDALVNGTISTKAGIPIWIMLIGAIGISLGLMLFGPKLIRTVGSEITELDQIRAFAIAMSAALTVIIASELGMPVSSTHIAVGAVLGVGFLREYLKRNYAQAIDVIIEHHDQMAADKSVLDAYLQRFERASFAEKRYMLEQLKAHSAEIELTKKERKTLNKVYKKELVKRSVMMKIFAAWIITVPTSALLAAFIYFAIRGMMGV
jgi:PiT family inorganic phosphate transporter